MKKVKLQLLGIVILLVFVSSLGIAQIKPARIFSDNMVLQREVRIPIWGTAEPGEVIEVSLSNSKAKTTADLHGSWQVKLPELNAGGPFELQIKGDSESITFQNVLIGDVWFASGQSNMEHPVNGWEFIPHSAVNKVDDELADTNYPQIRLFSVPKYPSPVEQKDLIDGEWEIAHPESVAGFSSVAWFFAKELNQKLNVPIGIINSSWGGTPIRSWMSRNMLEPFNDTLNISAIPEHFDNEEWSEKAYNSIEKHRVRRNQISYPEEGLPEEISKASFDDSDWKQINLLDRTSQFGNVVWLRKNIIIPEKTKDKPLNLSLGFLNRQANIYWNGHELGYCQYPKPVEFMIPENLVHSGENILLVRLATPFGKTQALGDSKQFFISNSDNSFQLTLVDNWRSNDQMETIIPAVSGYQSNSSFLFNGMVAPIVPFGLRGFIWYQGESDAGHPELYEKMFQQLINGWRNLWKNELPFLFVQLSNIESSHHFDKRKTSWCQLREVQKRTLSLPKTGMAVSLDMGDPYDIHPHNKQDFGHRLALQALKIAYKQDLIADGPTVKTVKQKGDTLIIHFSSELYIYDKFLDNKPCTIELSAEEGAFKQAKLRVKKNKLYVFSEDVKMPKAVRYAWENNPNCCLYNKENLPVAPFQIELE